VKFEKIRSDIIRLGFRKIYRFRESDDKLLLGILRDDLTGFQTEILIDLWLMQKNTNIHDSTIHIIVCFLSGKFPGIISHAKNI